MLQYGIPNCFLQLLFATYAIGILAPVAVKVRDTAIIPCYQTCNGDFLWELTTNNEKLVVLQCASGNCTEGDSFKNRVVLSEKIKPGNLSLTLCPVLYNDEGWYEATCGTLSLCKLHLEVLVPTTVTASVRDNVTLPCYARTKKQIPDDDVKILWKKDNQTVSEVQNGITKYGSDFTGRASVSLQHYKDGDLSLTIHRVRTSDNGLYWCYHDTEDHGHPGAVTLNVAAHQKVWTKKFGENLRIDLLGSDSVLISFTLSETTVEVCRVKGNNTTYSSEYSNRGSVRDGSFVLSGLTSSDTGTFTVSDNTGEVISINTVTVKSETDFFSRIRLYIAPFVICAILICAILICACLFLYYRRGHKALQYRYRYDAAQSNVDIDIDPAPLREPAHIGSPEQETNPEPEICPHTPVEETRHVSVRTIDDQDISKEEECILPSE